MDVAAFLEKAAWPLAVRSSSLLEDSQHQPFTGVYETLMLPNNDWSLGERLEQALEAGDLEGARDTVENARKQLEGLFKRD